ncbi:MAG: LysE family transporter, partial [Pseudomonadota bacterium]
LVIGLLIAAPVGPVNVLCIQRAIQHGPFGGLAAGLGAVMADGLIALGAALGISAITGLVTNYRDAIQIIGGLVLIAFAVLLLSKRPEIAVSAATPFSRASILQVAWDAPKAFFLTLTNPAAVLGLIAVFGGVSSFVGVRGQLDALALVAAIMVGSALWWTGLSAGVGRLRTAINPDWIGQINLVAGLALLVFAAVMIGEVALTFATGMR